MRIHATMLRTPVGPLSILVDESGICAAGFTPRSEELRARLSPVRRRAALRELGDLGDVSAAVAAYFAGEVGALDGLAGAQEGSPYHHRVWAALREIPAGRTVTYRERAERMGAVTAARAVGRPAPGTWSRRWCPATRSFAPTAASAATTGVSTASAGSSPTSGRPPAADIGDRGPIRAAWHPTMYAK